MFSRDAFIKQFRGVTLGKIDNQSSVEEHFQNETLRPILKLQNDLIIQIFKNYLIQSKVQFSDLSIDGKMTLVGNAIAKDTQLQNTLKGVIIALFTSNEYLLYFSIQSAINKRIRTMLIERIQSQLQLLSFIILLLFSSCSVLIY